MSTPENKSIAEQSRVDRELLFKIMVPEGLQCESLYQRFSAWADDRGDANLVETCPRLLEAFRKTTKLSRKATLVHVRKYGHRYWTFKVQPSRVKLKGTRFFPVPIMLFNHTGTICVQFQRFLHSDSMASAFFHYQSPTEFSSPSPPLSATRDTVPPTEKSSDTKEEEPKKAPKYDPNDMETKERVVKHPEYKVSSKWVPVPIESGTAKGEEKEEEKKRKMYLTLQLSSVFLPKHVTIAVEYQTTCKPLEFAEEKPQWYGPIYDVDMYCETTRSLLRIGMRRIKVRGTHPPEPLGYFGNLVWGLRHLAICLPELS